MEVSADNSTLSSHTGLKTYKLIVLNLTLSHQQRHMAKYGAAVNT